jgi:adenine-specific DNA methylase
MPDGYAAIILTHDLYICAHNKVKLSLTGGAERYVDFINQNHDKIICVLNGHTHADRLHYGPTGVPYIITQGDTLKEAAEDKPVEDRTPVVREKGTTTEQHFEVAIVDRDNKKIKLFSIGSQCQDGFDENPGNLA